MMKYNLSLKWFIALVFLTISIVLVIGYTKLAEHYFVLGMDNIIASNMERAAQSYLQMQTTDTAEINDHWLSHHWQQQSQETRDAFNTAPEEINILYKSIKSNDTNRPPDYIMFVMQFNKEDETVFVSRRIAREMISDMTHNNIINKRQTLLMIGSLTALCLAIVIGLLFWHVSRPLKALANWTNSLTAEKLDNPAPDFSYPELNELAELIRTSLSSVQNSLKREQEFLRHTSHELRTPISVIRNNIELLQHIQESDIESNPEQEQEILKRINRASLTMQNLTETLLWLSKESPTALPKNTLQLDDLIKEIVEETHYLLNDKNVAVNIETASYSIELPMVAAKIVISNLIRNAFQHTWEGEVSIVQNNNVIEIINTESTHDNSQDLGFGLGLRLTQQLTHRLGWHYENTQRNHHHNAKLILT